MKRLKKYVAPDFPLDIPLPLPSGYTEKMIFDFVTSIRVKDAPEEEMKAYGTHDFKRFLYTWGLVGQGEGKCLELGANPYFTTMLLRNFSRLELSLANYFGHSNDGDFIQSVVYNDIQSYEKKEINLKYKHFNVEADAFPYPDSEFDVVIFAEIIEHLLNDPSGVLRKIKKVLKPGGTLVLTTPNVARLENVAKMISGANIYDPYSGYGPYGRHNREYNRHELDLLLRFEGFEIVECFTSNVHPDNVNQFCDIQKFSNLIEFRKNDLGQYIFIKAVSRSDDLKVLRPSWLYRSYPSGSLA